MNTTATPFLKWAGGKTRLLSRILPRFPDHLGTYYEPFLGGGAVFFAMAAAQRFDQAVLADTNSELINLYRVVRDNCASLIRGLTPHVAKAKEPDWFYYVRSLKPAELEPIERAARTLFLNRTGFNGLYRVNRRGEFNVPFGKYPNPKVLDVARLEAASRALQGVELRCADFAAVAAEAGEGDGVYFDPPYVPISATSSFNAYQAEAFGAEAQEQLVDTFRCCWKRSAIAVMSNSDCEYTRELYRCLDVEVVRVPRAINSVGSGRGRVNELLVVGPGSADSVSVSTTSTRVLRVVSS
ncbi:MAG: DNA adenine methylase [Myxococcales bacterium]|nr:DNA adenine methylase [Myxococcales bacterium]